MSTLPSWFPPTQDELWAEWLSWRFPHYDAMERDAAAQLTGAKHAVVRVGWDGLARRKADYHASLFTLKHETPDPAAALAATQEHKPAGVVLHHVITNRPSADESKPADPRAAPLATRVEGAMRARQRLEQLFTDPRIPPVELERVRRAAVAELDGARADAEAAIAAGLEARCGFLLVPPIVVKPEALRQQLLYEVVRWIRDLLDVDTTGIPWRATGIAVCSTCTTVFTPKRATADYCHLCRDHPPPDHALGQRPWTPGNTQTVRAPKLAGHLILGWKSVTTGICQGCGKPFTARKDATACAECSPRLRQRRRRRAERPKPGAGSSGTV